MHSRLLTLLLLLIIPFTLFSDENTDTIIITAEMPEGEDDKHSVTVVTEDEIEALPGASTAELISSVMGVQLSKFGNDSQPSFVSIRGSSPEQVLVLLNGKKLNSSQGGGVDLSTIPVESIKSIEVLRGGESAVYGNSAFGGVVNIVTKDVEESLISVKYEFNSDLKNELSLNLYEDNDKFKISTNIDGIYSPGESGENEDITSGRAALSLETLIDETELSIYGNIYRADKGVPGTTEFPTDNARMDDMDISGGVGINYYDLQWSIDNLYKYRNYTDPDNIYGAVDSTHKYNSISSKLTYNTMFGEAELSGYYDYLDSDTFDEDYIDRKNISLFISTELFLGKLEIIPSARIDYDLDTEFLPSWNLNLTYPLLDERVVLSASGGSAYRKPSFNDLYWPSTSFAEGNEDLESEEAIIIDFGILYQITDSLKLDTTIYYHDVTNLIQWIQGANGVWSPDNLGSAEIKGIETEISYLTDFLPISGYIEGRLNYTYLSALNKEEGVLYDNQLINRAAHKGNAILIYYSDFDFTLSADFSYTGLRYTTAANTKSADPYYLLDLNFTKEIISDLTLTIYGKNILNQEYEDYRGYPVDGYTAGASLEYQF